MLTLHDVFSAIRADERDHVGTMQACLDPGATLRSASMEKRVLTGIALIATVSVLMSASQGDITGAGVDVEADTVGTLVDGSTAMIEAAVAGLGGLLQQVTSDGEEDVAMASAGLLDSGAAAGEAEAMRAGVVRVIQVFARFLGALL